MTIRPNEHIQVHVQILNFERCIEKVCKLRFEQLCVGDIELCEFSFNVRQRQTFIKIDGDFV